LRTDKKQYRNALERYRECLALMPDVPDNDLDIEKASKGLAVCYYAMAKAIYDKRKVGGVDLKEAIGYLDEARKAALPYGDADRLDEAIATYIRRYKIHLRDSKAITERDQTVAELIEHGKQLFEVRKFDEAEKEFENVLYHDKYNRDAMEFLARIAERKYAVHSLEQKYTRLKMMDQVADGWNFSLGEERVLPPTGPGTQETNIDPQEQALIAKLKKWIIPELSFEQASLDDIIDFLVQTSRDLDDEKVGINIISMIAGGGGGAAAAPAAPAGDLGGFGDDLFNDFGVPDAPAGGGLNLGGGGSSAPITLSLRRVSMMDALRFITEIASLHYRIDKNVVIIEKEGLVANVITRFYSVDPTLFSERVGVMSGGGGGGGFGDGGGFDDGGFGDFDAGGGGGGNAGMGDLRSLFINYGVPFPQGTSISYEPVISQLIVAQTPANLEKFEEILSKINIQPRQIEIEARFVEVLQTDLEEMGLNWRITDPVELAVKDGPGPVGSRERISLDAHPVGISRGVRYMTTLAESGVINPLAGFVGESGATFAGDIMTLRGVLTNPELQVTLHALDQKGNLDLLSAPRVTTINGVNAVIEIVREIIYPTEFDVSENDIQVNRGGGGGGFDDAAAIPFIPPTVIPGAFETREVGVILNVTPTVSPDNYTINLTMLPEIAELVGWLQYGSTIGLPDGSVFEVNMPQPLFASRNVTTSLIVWDGHTVVMGGLIREDLVTIEDKIPLLGDIPILGRLFTNKATKSEKRNLLIFVTARLVNPAGEPINSPRRQGQMTIGSPSRADRDL
jgi:general secretion pathway protein D